MVSVLRKKRTAVWKAKYEIHLPNDDVEPVYTFSLQDGAKANGSPFVNYRPNLCAKHYSKVILGRAVETKASLHAKAAASNDEIQKLSTEVGKSFQVGGQPRPTRARLVSLRSNRCSRAGRCTVEWRPKWTGRETSCECSVRQDDFGDSEAGEVFTRWKLRNGQLQREFVHEVDISVSRCSPSLNDNASGVLGLP